MTDGFLVVEKRPSGYSSVANPNYRGLYRTPPWSQDAFEESFKDPYVFLGSYLDEYGLIKSFDAVHKFKGAYGKMYSHDALEILFVKIHEAGEQPKDVAEHRFLGFDIAGRAPFWSVLVDPPPDRHVADVLTRINDYGLLTTAKDAAECLAAYLESKDQDYSSGELFIWNVYLVE